MKNITEMRDQLADVFSSLKDGSLTPKVASELNNTAGKMINSCRVQLEYQSKIHDKPNIAFLNGE